MIVCFVWNWKWKGKRNEEVNNWFLKEYFSSFFLSFVGRKEGKEGKREGGTHRYLDIDGILILFFIFFSLFFCSSQTWTAETNGGSWDWHSIASSSLGIKLIVVDNNGGYGGYLYTSTDSGRHELHD